MTVYTFNIIIYQSRYALSRYDGVCGYLESAGFSEGEQEKLRAIFLYPQES